MNLFTKHKSWLMVIIFGIGYAVVGIAFPNPSVQGEAQRNWRLAAWIAGAVIFGIQIWYEHFRLHNRPLITALHTAVAAALGALALAAAAFIHVLNSIGANLLLHAASLILWPVFIGVPAFLAAFVIAAVLAKLKPVNKT